MKNILFGLSLAVILIHVTGCKTGAVNWADRLSGTIVTQQVPYVITYTNTVTNRVEVPITNTVERIVEKAIIVQVTNEVGSVTVVTNTLLATNIEQVIGTRFAESVSNELRRLTNVANVPQIVASPTKDAIVGAASGTAGNLFGFGALATTLALGGLHLYQRVRNKKLLADATSQGMTKDTIIEAGHQALETLQEVIAGTPQGAVLKDKVTNYLVQHQAAAGVLNQVTQLVKEQVDVPLAKEAAQTILSVTTPKPNATQPPFATPGV